MSTHITLFFPGQGSQYVGMGKNLLDDPSCAIFFQQADHLLGHPLSRLCLEGPVEQLKLTENTQPAILTYSIALLQKVQRLIEKYGHSISLVMGHSVGEYAALVAAKSINFEEAVKAVRLRGKFMQEAVPPGQGKMVALLKVPEEVVREACMKSSLPQSEVMPANFNEPQQIVISGHAEACTRAVQWLEANYKEKFRAVELPVSAPFHSSLMVPAAIKLSHELLKMNFQRNELPYVANIDAKEYPRYTHPDTIRDNLIKQVSGSVLWTQSVGLIPENSLCLEVGPGNVLKGLAKKIQPQLKVLDMDRPQSFIELEEILA